MVAMAILILLCAQLPEARRLAARSEARTRGAKGRRGAPVLINTQRQIRQTRLSPNPKLRRPVEPRITSCRRSLPYRPLSDEASALVRERLHLNTPLAATLAAAADRQPSDASMFVKWPPALPRSGRCV